MEITFYKSWLYLDKHSFRFLTFIASEGGFVGNLSNLCECFGVSAQNSNKKHFKNTIEYLSKNGLIAISQKGRTFHIELIPQPNPIVINKEWVDKIRNRGKRKPSVAWEEVLKLYLYYCANPQRVLTDKIIAMDIGVSDETVSNAKRVLYEEFGSLKKKDKYKGFNYREGQIVELSAFWLN